MRSRFVLALAGALLLAGTASPAAAATEEVKLRNWWVGIHLHRGDRDHWDVFGQPDLPPGHVDAHDAGGGFSFGRRFGDRFLLGLQLAGVEHEIDDYEHALFDGEALVTGTVLFNEFGTVQPFVRGGIGGAIVVVDRGDDHMTLSMGPAAVAGAGLQLRASSRVSFELEGAFTVTNFLEAQDHPDGGPEEDWQVRASHVGWRVGMGMSFWF